MDTMQTYVCPQCEKSFERRLAETTRQRKENPNYKPYCSRKCGGEQGKKYLKKGGNPESIKGYSRRVDEYSPFRVHLGRCNKRKHDIDIDEVYLKELWDNQNGICPYTGFKMLLCENTGSKGLHSPYMASLDRIDSSKGYVKGNVEFVCAFINYAKNSWTREEFMEVISRLKEDKYYDKKK